MAFCATAASALQRVAAPLSVYEEVELRAQELRRAADCHEQLRTEEPVNLVARLPGEEKLRRQYLAARRLYLEVKMARTARVERGFNGAKFVASLGVTKYVPAIAKPAVIVQTVLIRVPQIKQDIRQGLAEARQNATPKCNQAPIGRGLY